MEPIEVLLRWVSDPNARTIHTNTVEGALSIFKRGMTGVYQHCGEQHLHRYLAEFEFRYNTGQANGFDVRGGARDAIWGVVGKRLTYKAADSQSAQVLSYDIGVRLGQNGLPDVGWPPHIGRKGTDRN